MEDLASEADDGFNSGPQRGSESTGGARMFKLRVFRMAVALSSLAALVSAVGADRKWG